MTPLPLLTLLFISSLSLSPETLSLISFNTISSLSLPTWNSHTNHCYWEGVVCQSNRVTSLTLISIPTVNPLGTLTPLIANLTHLRTLSLSHNSLSGQIPIQISSLKFLVSLDLQGNNFSGSIPCQISGLNYLRTLNLSFNALSGPIPRGLIGFGSITSIDLSNNRLSGRVRVENESSCLFLRHLKLSHNFLTGNVPPELSKCSGLRTLLLDGNVLEGRIPFQIGEIYQLRVLDVSRNSFTDSIPKELGNCSKLSAIVLTNLVDSGYTADELDAYRGEFNAFSGGVPYEVLLIPNLQIFWAPRANLHGRLPDDWNNSCTRLRVLNLGQNYLSGGLPYDMGKCKNLAFLDLSSNSLWGYVPSCLRVPCMVYFNLSGNQLTGVLPEFENGACQNPSFYFDMEDIRHAFSSISVWRSEFDSMLGENFRVVVHDFSWNRFFGAIPLFSVGDEFLGTNQKPSYRLVLSYNSFNMTLPSELVSNCHLLQSLSVDMSDNQITGEIPINGFPLNCSNLKELEASSNRLSGRISISSLKTLERLDLRNNGLSGSIPDELGELKHLKWILLGQNNLTGRISTELGLLRSLEILDLSKNKLTGSIPTSLSGAQNLQVILLNDNMLYGKIPVSLSLLPNLIQFDVSSNNLSGHIPQFRHVTNCDSFIGNEYLHSCPDPYRNSPAGRLAPLAVRSTHRLGNLNSFVIAAIISACLIACILVVVIGVVSVLFFGKRKLSSLVTFTEVPTELNYDNVIRSTDNFSIRNLIGTGGFGATYKAELAPGFLVAIKRLSIGRFQGIQQFDAEIRTLGRIRHRNLVTLIGYYVGESDMFLIYNYLSGGNLESFIHNRSAENVRWGVIHKIAFHIAQALAYLHYSCVPRIVHRDIKPSNILLDEELNAYLSDFGLARLLEVSETHATTDVAGTFGYVAPEYATTRRVSDKADVYSFGVVLLELMSGKKSLDPSFSEYGNGFNIVTWARLLMDEKRSSEFFYTELWKSGPRGSMMKMLRTASACTVESISERPTMRQVVEELKYLSS